MAMAIVRRGFIFAQQPGHPFFECQEPGDANHLVCIRTSERAADSFVVLSDQKDFDKVFEKMSRVGAQAVEARCQP